FSYIDRSVSADDSKHLNIKLLIENLKSIIMKKLSILYIIRSLIFLSTLSVSFSAALSQSLTSISVSDSSALTISISVISTLTTSALITAFITSPSCFKKILYRLSESHFTFLVALMPEVILIEDNNITETILSHSQASSITFSFFSARKIVCTL
ncbi:hypothetical protein BDDG_12257, partial [Blastomyces dermatitidis ATCC 18188]